MRSPAKARVLAYLSAKFKKKADMAKATGYTAGRITQFFKESEPMHEEARRNIAERLGLPRDYFEQEPAVDSSFEGVAQSVSYLKHTVLPHITWEQLMTGETLPERFTLKAPDDAMAPKARTGREIVWSTQKQAMPGAGILVRDRGGQYHMRRMFQGATPGRYEARPIADGYRAFDSETDGLTLIAVWDGLMGGLEDL